MSNSTLDVISPFSLKADLKKEKSDSLWNTSILYGRDILDSIQAPVRVMHSKGTDSVMDHQF